MTREVTISEVTNLAADYIEAFGWTSPGGWFAKEGEPTCAEGALDIVCGVQGKHIMRAAKRAVEEYLNLATTPITFGGRYLWNWNDTPGRTASEVIEVLRATAIIEAAKEDAALLAEAGRA